VFVSTVIKKRRHWPALIPGDTIDEKMTEGKVGDTDLISGTLDGVKYDILFMKERMYTMTLISSYAGLFQPHSTYAVNRHYIGSDKKEAKSSFKLQEPFDNRYLCRHAVDDHTNHNQKLPSLEDTWGTHRWSNMVFVCILAISRSIRG